MFEMKIPTYIIDAFTSTKFKGNPTSVCVLENFLDDATMHSIAKELNLPVTAFVELKKGENFPIKYFTFTGEIPACGHATLATAKVIFELTENNFVRFETIENITLEARLDQEIILLTYPKFEAANYEVSKNTLKSLGLTNYQTAFFCQELDTLFLELESPQILQEVKPDFKSLVESNPQIIEVVITSGAEENKSDYLLRSFCPWIGIDEDPVTGSVHSVLAGFWKNKLGKNKLVAHQMSERGGELYVTAFDDKVEIGGKAVLFLKGEIYV